MIDLRKRAYDGKYEVARLMHVDHLPTDLRTRHSGYPEYWIKRWVAVRVFNTLSEANNFVKEIS